MKTFLTLLFCLLFTYLNLGSSFLYSKEMIDTTYVEADTASYDGQEILLQGAVTVKNSLGVVHAQRASLKKGESQQVVIDFPYIELANHVELLLSNGSSLFCDELFIDFVAKSAHCEATSGLTYQDARGTISADEADLFYEKRGEKITPTKIVLMGNVKMEGSNKGPITCALANVVEIYVEENKTLLYGSPVLFYNKEENLELSANKVEAQRDLATGKERVVGHGKVRFTFAKEEIHKMQTHFGKLP